MYFPPTGDYICITKSMIRWYRHRGEWINCDLPHYIAIGRKPENGLEVQNAACGDSGIMLRLKLVKGDAEDDHDDEEDVNYGEKLI